MLTDIELSQHTFGDKDEEGNFVKQFQLIGLINRGLENIHTRFVLKKGELYIDTCSNPKYRYDLTDEEYILSLDADTHIVKVLEVWNECGDKLQINSLRRRNNICDEREASVQMVNKTTMVFDACPGIYRVVFQSAPKFIERPKEGETFYPERLELDLPLEYIDALIYYVASRLFSINQPMEGNAAPYSPGIVYSKRFEEECARLTEYNLEIDGIGDRVQRFRDSMFP